MENKELKPQLRFKGFKDNWRKTNLGEVSVFHDEKRLPLEKSVRGKRKGIYAYYGASGIIDHIDSYIFDGEFVLLGEDGANIIDRSSRLAFIAKGKFWVNNHAHVIQAKGSNYFLSEYLEQLDYDKYNSGTAQPKLNAQVCKKIEVILPSIVEQQKIASFLSAVDSYIENLTKQKEALEKYKKGMMQKIFSQEIRFKDETGNHYTKWRETRMKDLFEISAGGDAKNLDYSKIRVGQNIYPIYANALTNKGLFGFSSKPKIQKDSLTVTARGEIGHAIARVGGYTPIVRLLVLLPRKEVSTYFYECFINQMNIYIESTGVPQLTAPQLSAYKIKVPILEEQVRITAFLLLMYKLIEKKRDVIVLTNQWKKGLIQQLFV